jgi:tetratricopeptide (TPR) repeat protein
MAARAIVIRAGGLRRLPTAPPRCTRWLVIAALLATVTACGGSSANSATSVASHASFDDLIGAGTQLLARGNAAGAAQLFEQAVKKQPDDPVGYYDLGVAQAKEGLRRQSLADYGGALKADSKYVPALYNLGIAFSERRPRVAIFFLRRAAQLKPDSPTAFLQLGLIEIRYPKLGAQALQDLKRAIVLDPSLIAHIPRQLRARVRATHLRKPHPVKFGGSG